MASAMESSSDDFTDIEAEKYAISMASLLSKSQYGQVVFHDLREVYEMDTDLKCTYSSTDNIKPQPGDKIALFKVGWSSVSDFITFQHVCVTDDPGKTVFEVILPAKTLPKNSHDLYQLCYLTGGNVIAGASAPFNFTLPAGSQYIETEDPTDPGLVVFVPRLEQLEEDLKKAVREKSILSNAVKSLESSLTTSEAERTSAVEITKKVLADLDELKLRSSLLKEKNNKQEQEKRLLEEKVESLELQLKTAEAEKAKALEQSEKLLKGFEKMEKDSIPIRAELEQEKTSLKETIAQLEQRLKSTEVEKAQALEQSEKSMKELEETRKELLSNKKEWDREKMSLEETVAQLDKRVKSTEAEKTEALQQFEKSMKELEETNKKLLLCMEKISQEENSADMRAHKSLKVDEILVKELKDYQERLEAAQKESKVLKEDIQSKLDNLVSLGKFIIILEEKNKDLEQDLQQKTEISNSLEVKVAELETRLKEECEKMERLADTKEGIIENLNRQLEQSERNLKDVICEMTTSKADCDAFKEIIHELEKDKVELTEQIEKFNLEREKLLKELKSKKKAPESIWRALMSSFDDSAPSDISLFAENSEDCQKLKARIMALLEEKSAVQEQLVQLRHENRELESDIKEKREEAAALKSRVGVLEYELSTLKTTLSSVETTQHSFSNLSKLMSKFEGHIPTIQKFNSLFSEHHAVLTRLEQEKSLELQRKIEDLLLENSKIYADLHQLKSENKSLREARPKFEIGSNSNFSAIEIQKVLDDADVIKAELENKLHSANEKNKVLRGQLMELRKNLVGRVTVENTSENQGFSAVFKLHLQDITVDFSRMYLALSSANPTELEAIQDAPYDFFTFAAENGVICPMCLEKFPPASAELYVEHLDKHK